MNEQPDPNATEHECPYCNATLYRTSVGIECGGDGEGICVYREALDDMLWDASKLDVLLGYVKDLGLDLEGTIQFLTIVQSYFEDPSIEQVFDIVALLPVRSPSMGRQEGE